MLKYVLRQDTRKESKTKGQWYARPCTDGTVDLEALAKHMSQHNSPFSAGTLVGIMTDMVDCIRELVLDGKAVKIPNLAIFSLGLRSTGAPSASEFSVDKHIDSFKLRARATGEFRTANLSLVAKAKEQRFYDVDSSEKSTPDVTPVVPEP